DVCSSDLSSSYRFYYCYPGVLKVLIESMTVSRIKYECRLASSLSADKLALPARVRLEKPDTRVIIFIKPDMQKPLTVGSGLVIYFTTEEVLMIKIVCFIIIIH